MSDDWQPGDLALCVAPQRNRLGNKQVRPGGLYTVESLVDWFGLGLVLRDLPSQHPTHAHAASRFRKIRPHTPDAEDAETIALLTGGKVPA